MNDSRFAGKVAVITGAASGLGRATALRLADEGAVVACLDVAEDGAQQTASAIIDAGGKAGAVHCDVSHVASVHAALGHVVDNLGPPHVLVNAAGIGRFAHTTELALDEWSRTIAVNLTGTFLVCQAALPHLLTQGGGAIVNIASTAGVRGQPYSAAYSASKGGVVLLTKALALEYADRGIRANVVAPGGMETPMLTGWTLPEGANPALLARISSPLGFSQPEEVAATIAYVASDEARYMTGSVVVIDGGITA